MIMHVEEPPFGEPSAATTPTVDIIPIQKNTQALLQPRLTSEELTAVSVAQPCFVPDRQSSNATTIRQPFLKSTAVVGAARSQNVLEFFFLVK